MNYSQILNKVETLVAPVLEPLGLELIEREFVQTQGKWILRLYIDKEGGPISVGDCERASKSLEGVLDVENLIPSHYYLEISSPGIERPLRRPKDFQRFVGETIDLQVKESIDGRHHFVGILKGMEGEEVVLSEHGEDYKIPLSLLKKARLKETTKKE
ncbi:MAG: ribosome maturation factor RimP [Deltaproteobacteria bacterium]|nr:ribosome maturation factor RimP [Deltaproteobacteria bacterium]